MLRAARAGRERDFRFERAWPQGRDRADLGPGASPHRLADGGAGRRGCDCINPRPAHWPTAQHVEVEVEDALTCPGADVGDDPVPGLGDPGAPGPPRAEAAKRVARTPRSSTATLASENDVAPRDHQHVDRSAWSDVVERYDLIVLE